MEFWRWAREVEHPQAGGAPQHFEPADIAALKQLAAKCGSQRLLRGILGLAEPIVPEQSPTGC